MSSVHDLPESARRRLVFGLVVLAGASGAVGASLIPRRALAAPVKMSQSGTAYRTTPNGAARCDICIQWQAPASCKVVDGVISPAGWCSLYAPKS